MHELIMTPYGRLKVGGLYKVIARAQKEGKNMSRHYYKAKSSETFQGIYAGIVDDNHMFLVKGRVKCVGFDDIQHIINIEK